MKQTTLIKPQDVQKKWYLVDADGLVLGRLASQIAIILRGKNKPDFTPNVDCGDNVIVINTSKIRVTGKKFNDKKYYHHSQYQGGLKVETYKQVLAKKPTFQIERAVRLMLPKGTLGRKQFKHLFAYAGAKHQQAAQDPIKITIAANFQIQAVKEGE